MKKVEARVSKKGMGTASFNAGYGVGTIFPALLLISAFFGVLI